MSLQGVLFLLYQVVVIATIIHVVMDNRQPAKTVAWALVIYFVPLVGIIAYIFFGINTRKERLVSQRSIDQLTKRSMLQFAEQQSLQLPETYKPVIELFINEGLSLPFSGNKIDILTNGYDFFTSLLHDIAQAKSHIHIDIYIFEDDALGSLVADALIAKSRKGVEVRLVYDDVGCWQVKNSFFERLRVEGIEAEPFMPVRFPSFARRANYRNHRKLFVIDGKVGYVGGMNIALRYVKGRNAGKASDRTAAGNWRDTMLRIEGKGVYSLQRAFLMDWYFVDRTLLSDRKYYPSADFLPTPPTSLSTASTGLPTASTGLSTASTGLPTAILQTVTSGPTSPYPEIMQGYVRIIMGARNYVYIETPYFLPTVLVLYALKCAAQSGVDVRLLVPQKGDARFTEWASRSYLREVAEAGVQVSLYTPGFLHSKLMVCDDGVCSCGSTNIDFRSFENNFEANVFIFDAEATRRLKATFLQDESNSVPWSQQSERVSPKFLPKLGESLARLFSPLL
ncbi:MAG: PLDc N-terminal domain-containing protein [Prevotella sp.]|nr:PLDc N-terminal domain-containing protein [Prevotella sp.]